MNKEEEEVKENINLEIEDREKRKEFVVDGTKWEAKIDQTGHIEKYGTISLDKIYAKDENEIKKLHLLVDNILKDKGLYE